MQPRSPDASEVDVAVGRRRVVMLVENGVEGDSRVQKAARSMAARGWDVVLLGRASGREEVAWKIGDAQVRLIPFTTMLAKRRQDFRRRWLIAPLAYPPTGIAARRRNEVRAWRTDLAARRALRKVSGRPARKFLGVDVLRIEGLASKVTGRWVELRTKQLTSAQRARGRLTLPSDRLYTWFWKTVRGERSWRRLEPFLWDFELAFGPVITKLKPDLIHANDFRVLGVGARAAIRGRAAGGDVKLVWDAHEYLPGVLPWQNNARWMPGNVAHEREYAPYADAVVTVSPTLAEMLQSNHSLSRLPDVVLNAPALADLTDEPVPDIRELCGIGPDTPLLVYSGGAAEKRGLNTMIEAMPYLPSAHVALVADRSAGPYVAELARRAEDLGGGDRLHVLPYVPYHQVVPFLAGADVGIIPIRHFPNHEIALITKFFEYSHARLPIVVSDVRTMADTVRRTGQGEVFRADDVEQYVRAVSAVLAEPKRYRAAYDQRGLLDAWTWERQAEILDSVYRRLLDAPTPAHIPRPAEAPMLTDLPASTGAAGRDATSDGTPSEVVGS